MRYSKLAALDQRRDLLVVVAAEKRLHTAQPSLSRQMRDLEQELGVTLMVRGRGVSN